MISIDRFEEIVRAIIEKDKAKALSAIETEIKKEKQKGHHRVVQRLKNLLRLIAEDGDHSKNGYTTANYRAAIRADLKTNNQLYELSESKISLKDVVISEENDSIVKSLINEWTHIKELKAHGLSPNNRILLHGEPGTGKTKLAHAISNKIGYELVTIHLDELISSYLGKTGKNIREVFDTAGQGQKIILLDEIDAIAKQRNDSQDTGELKRVVTVFLQRMDSLPDTSMVIGATNHEELLDKAIWRRFPIRLNLNLPERGLRKKLLLLFMGEEAHNVDLANLATLTEGLSGSAIEDIAKGTLKKSILTGKPVNMVDAVKLTMMYSTDSKSKNNFKKKHWKHALYDSAQYLFDNGYSLKQIENISDIPYTTLREHIG